MHDQLRRFLDSRDGLATWADACAAVNRGAVRWALDCNQVVQPLPGLVADPAVDVRLRAALMAAGPDAALSHTTALGVWRLPVPDSKLVHVMTGPGRRIRLPRIVAHRRSGFTAEPPAVVVRSGLRVTNLETSLVDAWPLLDGDEQRAPLILAVNGRRTTPQRVRAALVGQPRLARRVVLVNVLDLLEAGCRSELELFGFTDVFAGSGFETLQWQVPVRVGPRTYWLDAYDPESATNFELDGRRYHSSEADRERDLRRDAKLAACGILPVRYTHTRLHTMVAEVRQEALGTMAVRRGLGQYVRGALIGSPVKIIGRVLR
jgi:hypothetical protein